MKKDSLLIWIFCSLSFIGYTQQKQDYLLTLKQDTLYGKILSQSHGLAPITFIYESQKMNYHPTSIQFFGLFRNNIYQHFKTLRSEKGQAFFVQIIENNGIKLYKYKEEHIYPNSTLVRYVYLMGPTDDQLTTLSSSNYQRILNDFLKEEPALLAQLENTSFQEVPELIKQYNEL